MRTLEEIFGVKEEYKLPDAIMEMLLGSKAAERIKEIKNEGYGDLRDIFQTNSGDRAKLKQDFTPDGVCEIVAGMTLPGTVCDFCSGTGALSKAAAKKREISVNEYEFSEKTVPYALLDACINGIEGYISRADVLREKVEKTYRLTKKEDISTVEEIDPDHAKKYKNIIMNPPYSMKFPDAKEYNIMNKEMPNNRADYGFILRGLEHMEENGRLIAVLSHGVLFRGGKEEKIRKWLIKEKMISAIMGLPDKLFMNTSIPVFLLVLEKESENVLFIDASKEFKQSGKYNVLQADHMEKILQTFENRKEIEKFSHVATYREIEENDYNLNIPRYVDTFEPEELPEMNVLLEELMQIDKEEEKIRNDLYKILGNLTGKEADMKVVEKHRRQLKRKKNEIIGQMTLEDML